MKEAADRKQNWARWGPYLSERQWGTVREDYSADGSAWDDFSHDAARSRAYRWGEDGIGGVCDNQQRVCLALALWNGRDPILKERLFGLTNAQGNHGEDCKEQYYYLDAIPSHAYLKMLYKYPQAAYPYADLVEENQRRGAHDAEYELIDTGVFDDDRYFDVFIEYAKAGEDDILMQVTVENRGPDRAELVVLPQLWFRNTWSWTPDALRPMLVSKHPGQIAVDHPDFKQFNLYYESQGQPIFTENETNPAWVSGQQAASGYYKDAFHQYLIHDYKDVINPEHRGSKAGVIHRLAIPGQGSAQIRLRLCPGENDKPFIDFDRVVEDRRAETDAFYTPLQADIVDEDLRRVQRQAFAGMIWSKQFYYYDVPEWLKGDSAQPTPPAERLAGRNATWSHLNNADIISMPDKWEYPWYAAWDLAFHCIPLALIDAKFAKEQLVLLTREWYMHPNGQLPAYEWSFSDVNPPVHAWAAWRVFKIDRKQRGDAGDLAFLERVFHKLLLNFTWWVNRKDTEGHNIFEGGFLGLDNIGLFDRSAPLPTDGRIHQSDGTSWMAMYCLNLMRIALELARYNHVYEDIASKFFEHFLHIAEAMTNMGGEHIGLWDEEDQFYYDALYLPNDHHMKLKIRSMVGLIPLFAVETLEPALLDELPGFKARMEWFLDYRPDLASLVSRWREPGLGDRRLLSLLRGSRMKAMLRRMLDETEFLSDYGVRALSKVYEENPYELHMDGQTHTVAYRPAESDSTLFGGNSNWRGPIWFPVNYLIIESLQKFHHYYGDDFKVECPTGSGKFLTINEVADELTRRLIRIFQRDESGKRPVFGGNHLLQTNPHFRDYVLFHEYFHGDNGSGVGASHQTGWTGLIAKLIQKRRPEK